MIMKQEELEIVGVQWLGTAHFRKKLPAHVNPSHWDALCRLPDAKTIIAQRDARIAELEGLLDDISGLSCTPDAVVRRIEAVLAGQQKESGDE